MDATRYTKYVDIALEMGAKEARVVPASSIRTAAWTRLKCQYGCPNYRTNLCCPPNTPTAEEMRKVLNDYSFALLMRFPSSGGLNSISEIERAIFLDGMYKAFGLKGGGCSLCPKCNLDKCIHPQEARPSMEAVGIDVFETVRENGFSLDIVKNKSETQSYYGLILIE